ncbi:prion-like-(Q/N-rich) domain-bearing protein 25, partial [Elysia marginata]
MSRTSVLRVLTNKLNNKKKFSKWVPHLLTESNINGSCSNTKQCVGESLCVTTSDTSDTCQCPPGKYKLNDTTCELKSNIDGSCSDTSQCVGESLCHMTSGTSGTCQCPPGKYKLNDTTCELKSNIDGSCSDIIQCVGESQCVTTSGTSGTCQCPPGKYKLNDTTCELKIIIGGSCSDITQCVGESICTMLTGTEGICQCPTGKYKLNDTTCERQSNIDGSCSDTFKAQCVGESQCVTTSGTSGTCQCPPGKYKLNDTTCEPKIGHTGECQDITGECGASGTSCQSDRSGTKRCLCAATQFWNSTASSCQDLNSLQVTGIGANSTSLDEITVTWTEPSQASSLSLSYEVTRSGLSQISTTSGNTSPFSGLTPGNSYLFSVITVVREDAYYNVKRTDPVSSPLIQTSLTADNSYRFSVITVVGEDAFYEVKKTAPVSSPLIKTKIAHAGECQNVAGECGVDLTSCQLSRDGKDRCLCALDHFWNSQSQLCENLNLLEVTGIGASSKSLDEIIVTWTEPSQASILSLSYEVTRSGLSQISTTSGNTSPFSGLTADNSYRFFVVTVVGEDKYYKVKKTDPVSSPLIQTEIDHSGICQNSNDCGASGTVCRADKGGSIRRCLCAVDNFWDKISSCQSITKLKVTSLRVRAKTVDSVTLAWVQPLQSLTLNLAYEVTGAGKPGPASATGVEIKDLTPGTMYNFQVRTVVGADEFYNDQYTSGVQEPSVWTRPAEPAGYGEVTKLDDGTYNFTFEGSRGQVKEYSVTIGTKTYVTSSTWISNLSLEPDKVYMYTIVARNGINEVSSTYRDTFQVGAERPGEVFNLTSTDKTSISLNIEWKTPLKPNGDLVGYLVTYVTSGSPCMEINITCHDCTDLWPPRRGESNCSSVNSGIEKSQNFLNTMSSVISLTIDGLKAYKTYTISVQAINEAGYGRLKSIESTTSIGPANNLEMVTATKTGSDRTAGLAISWTPTEKTGPTEYEVTVKEETSINSNSYIEINRTTVIGYETTSLNVGNLLAFWKYQVSVTASTGAGDSQPKVEIFTTKENIPGEVTAFDVVLDSKNAQEFTLTFGCPEEKKRNGELRYYTVQRSSSNS